MRVRQSATRVVLESDRVQSAEMSRTTRVATSTVLAVALAALPLALDQCAASCEVYHHAVAGTPSCHHTTAPTTRVGHVPVPCGHDHTGTVVAAANQASALLRAFDSAVAVLIAPIVPSRMAVVRYTPAYSPPGSALTLDARLLPLRI